MGTYMPAVTYSQSLKKAMLSKLGYPIIFVTALTDVLEITHAAFPIAAMLILVFGFIAERMALKREVS